MLVDELQPGSDKPHHREETFSSESDRLPLRKTEGRSAWGGAVIGSECEVPPQSLAVGLCPIAGQERSSASSDPHGSASAPRGQPQGTTGRGEQPEGSPRAEAEEADSGSEGQVTGRQPLIPRAPPRVSLKEREEHEVTHTPYRSWCPYCVRGRGRNTPHRKRDSQREGDRCVPKVSMD